MQFKLLIFIVLIFSFNISAQSWDNINPMQSTINDVEKITGKCFNGNNIACRYEMEEQNVVVIYYQEMKVCPVGKSLKIPVGTVLSIAVYPLRQQLIGELNINLNDFIKTDDPEVIGVMQYSSEEKGITIETNSSNYVLGMYYLPSAKNKEKLNCK